MNIYDIFIISMKLYILDPHPLTTKYVGYQHVSANIQLMKNSETWYVNNKNSAFVYSVLM